jgi:hypothetical protein
MNVMAVIVLYKRSLEQSQTLVALSGVLGRNPGLLETFRILVWDNSPTALASSSLGFPFDYIHSTRNVGNAGAFNRAMELAEAKKIPWLLLLDQDTTLPEDFLPKMAKYSDRFLDDPEVAVVMPLLWCRGKLISPKRLAGLYRILPMPQSYYGTYYREPMIACDSAALMRVEALREAGGYDEDLLWLDFSDIYVFNQLRRNRRSAYIASDLELQHSLAIMDYDNDMTPKRYRNFLAAEGVFFEKNKSRLDNLALTLVLVARATKQYLRYIDKTFAKMTWITFFRRILVTKERRMRAWEEDLRQRG